jgi:hypothetical protein
MLGPVDCNASIPWLGLPSRLARLAYPGDPDRLRLKRRRLLPMNRPLQVRHARNLQADFQEGRGEGTFWIRHRIYGTEHLAPMPVT